jgi:hypothetical protein
MKFQVYLRLSCLVVLLVACSTSNPLTGKPDTRPDDFSVQYHWQEGSLPPPYHYEYTIRINATGEGQVEMIPDYPSEQVPVWTEPFTVSQADLDKLFQTMADQGVFTRAWRAQDSPPVGGSSEWLTVTANGREIEIPAYVLASQASAAAEVYSATKALAPQAVWDKLTAQREEYVQEHTSP